VQNRRDCTCSGRSARLRSAVVYGGQRSSDKAWLQRRKFLAIICRLALPLQSPVHHRRNLWIEGLQKSRIMEGDINLVCRLEDLLCRTTINRMIKEKWAVGIWRGKAGRQSDLCNLLVGRRFGIMVGWTCHMAAREKLQIPPPANISRFAGQ
jgi:hypothetical protein